MSIHLLYTGLKKVGGRGWGGSHIQESILSLLLAQPYCVQKVLHEGRSVHIIKPNRKKQERKKQFTRSNIFFLKNTKKKRKYTYKKCFIRLIKQHKNCYKKGRRALWSGTISLRFYTWQLLLVLFFFSLKETEAGIGRESPGQVDTPPPLPATARVNSCTVIMSLVRKKKQNSFTDAELFFSFSEWQKSHRGPCGT